VICVYDRLPEAQPLTWSESHFLTATPVSLDSWEQGYDVPISDIAERNPSPSTIDHNNSTYLDYFQTYSSPVSPESMSQNTTCCGFILLLKIVKSRLTTNIITGIPEDSAKIFPGSTYEGGSFVHHWIQYAHNCPSVFNAWLYSGEGDMQYLEQPGDGLPSSFSQDTYKTLLVEREAILCLQDIINSATSEKVTDEIIIAALALALHLPERKENAASKINLDPLSNLQFLSQFNDIVVSETHVNGLQHLVEARGGFGELKMPGLKQALSLSVHLPEMHNS
jgi:hypothetical protein